MKCARKWNAAAAEADFGTPRSSPHSRTTPPHPRAAHTVSCRSFFLRTPLPGLLFIILFLVLLLLTPIPATHKVEGSYNLVLNIYIYIRNHHQQSSRYRQVRLSVCPYKNLKQISEYCTQLRFV